MPIERKRGGPKGEKCGDCIKWDYTSSNMGFCRARPPMPAVMARSSEYILVWPSTGVEDWCADSFEKLELVS